MPTGGAGAVWESRRIAGVAAPPLHGPAVAPRGPENGQTTARRGETETEKRKTRAEKRAQRSRSDTLTQPQRLYQLKVKSMASLKARTNVVTFLNVNTLSTEKLAVRKKNNFSQCQEALRPITHITDLNSTNFALQNPAKMACFRNTPNQTTRCWCLPVTVCPSARPAPLSLPAPTRRPLYLNLDRKMAL